MTAVPIAVVLDDAGMDDRVDEAAVELALSGRISGISCQVGAPRWPATAVRLRALAGRGVDIGLHLDLTAWPLTMPARPLSQWIGRAYARRLDPAALREEVRAQLDAFEDAHGRPADHVDGHQHVHQLPQVREALLEILARRGARPWLRDTRAAPVPGARWSESVKARVIAALGSAGLRTAARRQGLALNARFLGVYGFGGGPQAYARRLQGWVAQAGPADLIVTHAAVQAVPGDVLADARPDEWSVLSSDDWPHALENSGRVVRPMSHILAEPRAAAGAPTPPA